MRSLILAAIAATALSAPLAAQSVSFPSTTFPEPGTFCGPFQLCQPEVTRGPTR
ncbi:hypothetical protein [Hasllibacter sp. MH4015]|uniref:hypothetical protein n=1 Tax=Hasllibacter sp. MH4015 TaxID=2854029 RepID=UPI001CD66982|nr:hypothetical protein [Hasllibacter sp. MH4015]